MKKSALLEMLGDESNHPDALNRGFNTAAWKNMGDPMAIIALASHVIPSGTGAHEIAVRLETMLSGLTIEQLTSVYKWATIKYRRDLTRACETHIVAMIERIDDETDDVPDWIIAFSSMHCAQDFSEQIRYAAIKKMGTIAHHVSAQLAFVGDDGP